MSDFSGVDEVLVKQLWEHRDVLQSTLVDCEEEAARIPELRDRLARAEAALAALTGAEPVMTTAAPDEFACPDCPRRFSSKRGLSRHVGAAHPSLPPVDMSATLLGDES